MISGGGLFLLLQEPPLQLWSWVWWHCCHLCQCRPTAHPACLGRRPVPPQPARRDDNGRLPRQGQPLCFILLCSFMVANWPMCRQAHPKARAAQPPHSEWHMQDATSTPSPPDHRGGVTDTDTRHSSQHCCPPPCDGQDSCSPHQMATGAEP